ncbi:GIY-YIG nuclease family protein [Vibrio sp. 10N.261.55.A7]|uniref:GIY-YIG nuclease family protein n=1 Tax=Vibrio sp. 10N.261.55.A7 TaxID=1880851 RepID=UPI001F53DFC5|nr:GIY-YIG nuclease family protein [Vibrio sp. 10N.261.55.A7]
MAAVLSEQKGSSNWFIYFVRTPSNALYCGITTDVTRRFKQHCSGKGAKALKGKAPLVLEWSEPAGSNRSEASKIEYQVKRLTKAKKEALALGKVTLQQALVSSICKKTV